MDTKVMVTVPLAHLRRLPGSAALEEAWIEARTAESGWLSAPWGTELSTSQPLARTA